jgi:hypothetical protein
MTKWGIEENQEYWQHPEITLDDDLWWIVPARPSDRPVRLTELLPTFAARSYVLVDHSTPLDATDGADAYLHDRHNDLHVRFESMESGDFYLGVKSDIFLDGSPEEVERYAGLFLAAGVLCLEQLGRPYAFAGSPFCPRPRLEDLASGVLTYVFWAQWFGPDVVAVLGSDTLADAPAWRNEPAAGGVLYSPASSPIQATDWKGRWASASLYFTERYSPPPIFQLWNQIPNPEYW